MNQIVRIETLEMHTGGEPLRIVMSGFPEMPSQRILDTREYLRKQLDHLRMFLMWEPRGHADMYGLIKVPPERSDSSFGVIFMHNEGYSTMCGHATIAIGRCAIDQGWVEKLEGKTQFKIDAPCGQIEIEATVQGDKVSNVSFYNVPSFYLGTFTVQTKEWGEIKYDLAYGGAFYGYIDVGQINAKCNPNFYSELIRAGKSIKKQIIATNDSIVHPFEQSLSFLYGIIFIDDAEAPGIHSRNVCVFADGQVDRCSTGSGISGRAAIHYAKSEIMVNEKITIQSILGTSMDVEIVETTSYGPYTAVIPKVSGMAYYTGRNEFFGENEDSLLSGFLLR